MSEYRIVLADNQILFREGLKKVLANTPEQALVGQAGSGPELFKLFGEPDS